jgi:hypothetical protein
MVHQLSDQVNQVRRRVSTPRICGNAVGAWVQPDSQPIAGHCQAFAEQLRAVRKRHRDDNAGGSGGKRESDSVGALHAGLLSIVALCIRFQVGLGS